ncbi:hypothetical protein D3C79_427250 [compost metagenome]
MVKHPVQHQFHPHLVSTHSQTLQGGIAAEIGIDLVIVFGIVFMHARRGENRVQVQRRDAQFLQVRQLLIDAIQIAAIESGSGIPVFQRMLPVATHHVATGRVMAIAAVLNTVLAAAAGETIGENLIKYLIRHPGRAAVRFVERKLRQLARRDQRPPLRPEPLLTIGPHQFEAVAPRGLSFVQRQAGLITPPAFGAVRFHDQQPFFVIRLGA